jgi:hypothetical protein
MISFTIFWHRLSPCLIFSLCRLCRNGVSGAGGIKASAPPGLVAERKSSPAQAAGTVHPLCVASNDVFALPR